MEVYLSQYQQTDINELFKVITKSASHLKTYMPWLHANYSIEDTEQWVNICIQDWENKRAFRYLVRDKLTNRIVGAVGLENRHKINKIAELGYWVAESALNQSVATNAAKLAVIEAFSTHDIQRIEINILAENTASNRVAEKLAARFEGLLRNKIIHQGNSCSANCYSLIPSDIEL